MSELLTDNEPGRPFQWLTGAGHMLSFRKMRNQTCVQIGLTVINQGSTGSGIVFSTSVGTLHVEDCVVSGFSVGRPSSAGLTRALAGLTSVQGQRYWSGPRADPKNGRIG